jgi:hypothetical protein
MPATIAMFALVLGGCPGENFFEPCRSQCELAGGSCDEQPLGSFTGFETTASEWEAEYGSWPPLLDDDGKQMFPFVYAGQCSSGMKFLFSGTGYTTLTHFFEGNSGEFIALRTGTDVADSVCHGRSYWPHRVECLDATVTSALIGELYGPGDPISP